MPTEHQFGVDLSTLGLSTKIAVATVLGDPERTVCAVKQDGTDWVDYPVVAGSVDGAFDEEDNLLSVVPEDCAISLEDLEIMKRQKIIEAAGYQWQERWAGPVGGYAVAVTRVMMSDWTVDSMNVSSWNGASRLDTWRQATTHAMDRPAAGSAVQKEHAVGIPSTIA